MRGSAFTVVLLLACAHTETVWRKPGADHQAFLEDRYACTQESRTSWAGGGTGWAGAIARHRAKAAAEDQANELFSMCMEARGWRLVEVTEAVPKKHLAAQYENCATGSDCERGLACADGRCIDRRLVGGD